jgi:Nuclease-related domain
MPGNLSCIATTANDRSGGLLRPLPFARLLALVAPRRPICKARFFPAAMPPALARPAFRGERRVSQALSRAPLPAGTLVCSNRAPPVCRRRPDFLILFPDHGIIAVEVKGGRFAWRGDWRQPLAGTRFAKRIEPWLQSHRALAEILVAFRLNLLADPHASIVAMPATSAGAIPFPSVAHMLTSEELEPRRLARKLEALLPRLDPAAAAALEPALDAIAGALARPADRRL